MIPLDTYGLWLRSQQHWLLLPGQSLVYLSLASSMCSTVSNRLCLWLLDKSGARIGHPVVPLFRQPTLLPYWAMQKACGGALNPEAFEPSQPESQE